MLENKLRDCEEFGEQTARAYDTQGTAVPRARLFTIPF